MINILSYDFMSRWMDFDDWVSLVAFLGTMLCALTWLAWSHISILFDKHKGRQQVSLSGIGLDKLAAVAKSGHLSKTGGAAIAGLLALAIAEKESTDERIVDAADYRPLQVIPELKAQADRMERLIKETAAVCEYNHPIRVGFATGEPMAMGAAAFAGGGIYYGLAMPFAFTDEELQGAIAHEIYHLMQPDEDREYTVEDKRAEEIAADEFSFRHGFAKSRVTMLAKYQTLHGEDYTANHEQAIRNDESVHETDQQRIARAERWVKEHGE